MMNQPANAFILLQASSQPLLKTKGVPMAYHNRLVNSQMLPIGAMLLSMSASSLLANSADSNATIKAIDIQESIEIELPRYQPGVSKTAKTGQLAHDVPQAITVVTKELLHDKSEFTLKEALSNVAGLTFNAAEGGRIGDNMNLRGFFTFGDIYLDGIRDVAQYNRDTFNIESVDVLRGGAAMLFGRGQAGGVVNQVSKDAEAEEFGKLSVTLGSDNYKRASIDVNTMINDTTAIRINAMGMDAGSTRDNVFNESVGFAPTVTFGLDTDNEFSLSHYYLKTHITPDFGVPFDTATKSPAEVGKHVFYGFDDDYEDNEVHFSTASYTHKFTKEAQLRSILRHANYVRDNWSTAPGGYNTTSGPDNTVTRSTKTQGAEETTDAWQNDFTAKFKALGMKHEVLVGTEVLLEEQTRWRHSGSNAGNAIADAFNPNPSDAPGNPQYGNKDRDVSSGYDGQSFALYAQESLEIVDDWKIMGGLRKDWLSMDSFARSSAGVITPTQLSYNHLSYRAGLSYQPTPGSHYYFSWNESFSPTADLYSFSSALPPETSETYELGAKWDLFGGDLSLRASLYKTIKHWERETDVLTAAANPIRTKKRHTDGFELETAGRITENWEIFSGIALMDAQIDEVAPAYQNASGATVAAKSDLYVGKRPPNATDYTFNVWTTYKLANGWKVGGGAEGKGDRAGYGYSATATAFNPNTAPSYVRYDGMLSHSTKKYNLQLNVKNLFNTTYYDAIYINGPFVVPGTGRTFQVTWDYKIF
jgi:catecholate siderophore receptor